MKTPEEQMQLNADIHDTGLYHYKTIVLEVKIPPHTIQQ